MIVQKITSTYSLNGVSYETRVVYVVYESLLGKKGRKRERRRKIVQTDSMEIEIPKVFSNTCVRACDCETVARATLIGFERFANGLNRCVAYSPYVSTNEPRENTTSRLL